MPAGLYLLETQPAAHVSRGIPHPPERTGSSLLRSPSRRDRRTGSTETPGSRGCRRTPQERARPATGEARCKIARGARGPEAASPRQVQAESPVFRDERGDALPLQIRHYAGAAGTDGAGSRRPLLPVQQSTVQRDAQDTYRPRSRLLPRRPVLWEVRSRPQLRALQSRYRDVRRRPCFDAPCCGRS